MSVAFLDTLLCRLYRKSGFEALANRLYQIVGVFGIPYDINFGNNAPRLYSDRKSVV